MSEQPPLTKPLPYSNRGDLTTGPIRKHLLRLSVPMIWALSAIISVQLVDTFFISMLGERELAGISFTFPVTMLISHLVFGLNVAMSSVISRLIGEKKIEDAKRVTLHGICLAFFVACIIAVVCWLFLDPIFIALGADAQTLPVIRDYMPLWLFGSAILAIPVNSNSAIRASGDTFLPSLVMLTIALSNLVLAPVFIFGWFGFPAMKVFGAALATVVSCFCGLAFGVYVLVVMKNMIPRDGFHGDKFFDSLRRLAVIAIPAGLTNIIGPGVSAFVVAVLSLYGHEAVAAFGIVTRVEAMSLIVVIALALGMAPIIGQNWGAKKFDRVHETIITAIAANFIWSFFVAALFAIFARQIAGSFSSSPAVIHYAALFFWLVPVTYGFGNIVFGWSSAFNAMGEPQRAFFMIAVKSIVMTIPAVLIGSALYGVAGVFLALALVNVASGVIFHATSWRACVQRETGLQAAA